MSFQKKYLALNIKYFFGATLYEIVFPLLKVRPCYCLGSRLTHFSIVKMSSGEVVRPVHDVETCEGQRKDDPRYDVNTLGLGKCAVAN